MVDAMVTARVLIRPLNGLRYLEVCMPEEQRRWEVERMTGWERSLRVFEPQSPALAGETCSPGALWLWADLGRHLVRIRIQAPLVVVGW